MKIIAIDTLRIGHMAAGIIDDATWRIIHCRVDRTPAAVQILVERFRPLQCACHPTDAMCWLVGLLQANEVGVLTDTLRRRRPGAMRDDDAQATEVLDATRRCGRWRHADDLARRAALGALYAMPMPVQRHPAWPQLIRMRRALRFEHARLRAHIRSILRQERMPANHCPWHALGRTMMRLLAKPLPTCDGLDTWRGILHLLMRRLEENEAHMAELMAAFNAQAAGVEVARPVLVLRQTVAGMGMA